MMRGRKKVYDGWGIVYFKYPLEFQELMNRFKILCKFEGVPLYRKLLDLISEYLERQSNIDYDPRDSHVIGDNSDDPREEAKRLLTLEELEDSIKSYNAYLNQAMEVYKMLASEPSPYERVRLTNTLYSNIMEMKNMRKKILRLISSAPPKTVSRQRVAQILDCIKIPEELLEAEKKISSPSNEYSAYYRSRS